MNGQRTDHQFVFKRCVDILEGIKFYKFGGLNMSDFVYQAYYFCGLA